MTLGVVPAGAGRGSGMRTKDEQADIHQQILAGVHCTCICHHQPGVTHMVPCCDRLPLDPFAPTSAVPQIPQPPLLQKDGKPGR